MESSVILKALRKLMVNRKPEALSALIIPNTDAHDSEYLAEKDKRLQFVSGFTGSAGTAIITSCGLATLWTDGRYFSQAAHELSSDDWSIQKSGEIGALSKDAWLLKHCKPGSLIGIDPHHFSAFEWEDLQRKIESGNLRLIPTTEPNLVDKIWGSQQPGFPNHPVFPLEYKYTGMSCQDKISLVRNDMRDKKVGALLLSALDDIAYLFNLRGSDIEYNPLFFSYAILTQHAIFLFMEESLLPSYIVKEMKSFVEFRPYDSICEFLKGISVSSESKLMMSLRPSQALVSVVSNPKYLLQDVNPVTSRKAIKNETEIQGFINCHIRDAAALCCYFAWLEKEIETTFITEVSGAEKLEAFRREMSEEFVSLSFSTISASGPSASIIHYHPKPETCRQLTKSEIYLVDSGAQYKNGTTDVTRTLHFGVPSQREREMYTRVLKGQISLSTVRFPSTQVITGHMLDSFARRFLWNVGLDYKHGTGHGVGSFLNVHEGPMGISYKYRSSDPGLMEGMVLSIEPGYYEDESFGIRLENLVVIRQNSSDSFLSFQNLTLVPYQRHLMDPSLLSVEEISWLNDYHEECREKIGPILKDMKQKDGLSWLFKETEPFG